MYQQFNKQQLMAFICKVGIMSLMGKTGLKNSEVLGCSSVVECLTSLPHKTLWGHRAVLGQVQKSSQLWPIVSAKGRLLCPCGSSDCVLCCHHHTPSSSQGVQPPHPAPPPVLVATWEVEASRGALQDPSGAPCPCTFPSAEPGWASLGHGPCH